MKLLKMANILVLTSIGAACTSSDDANVEKAAISFLAADSTCQYLPVDAYINVRDIKEEEMPWIKLLVDKGLITTNRVTAFPDMPLYDSYVFTAEGKKLILIARKGSRMGGSYPCVKTGRYSLVKLEAVEHSVEIDGKPLALARVKIKFEPEQWVLPGKNNAELANFWNGVAISEQHSWLYRFMRSGNAYYAADSHGEMLR